MIEFEFDYALHALSGVAESLHAAGVEVCVPTQDDMAEPVGDPPRPRGRSAAQMSCIAGVGGGVTE